MRPKTPRKDQSYALTVAEAFRMSRRREVAMPSTLSPADRCDRCGAQAYLRAELMAGPLLFCGHHARQFRDGLLATAASLVDESVRVDAP